MSITPNPFSVSTGSSIELTSAINNAVWSAIDGSGTFSAGSTGYKKVFSPTTAGSKTIRAEENLFTGLSGFSVNQFDNGVVKTAAAGSAATASAKIYLKTVGDYVEFTRHAGWTNSSINFLNGGGGYAVQITDSNIYDSSGSPAASFSASTGDVFRVEVITGGYLRVKRNGTTIWTATTVPSFYGSYGYNCYYYDIGGANGTVFPRPVFSAAATDFQSETASGTVYAPVSFTTASPLADSSLGASESVNIVASGGVGSISFSVTSGSLPTGKNLSSGGVLSGAATVIGVYNFTIQAQDSAGHTASRSYTQTVVPQQLKATVSGSPVSVSFFAENETGANFYLASVYSSPWQIGFDKNVLPQGNYQLRAEAADAAGNVGISNLLTCTVIHDYLPPTVPQNFGLQNLNDFGTDAGSPSTSATFIWDPSSDNQALAGYEIQRATNSAFSAGIVLQQFPTTANTGADFSGLSYDTHYWFRVRAFDAAGNISGWSNVVDITL